MREIQEELQRRLGDMGDMKGLFSPDEPPED